MNDRSNKRTNRVPPLNPNKEEAELLWEWAKHEIGREENHTEEKRDTAESLHTKIGNLVGAFEDE